MGTCVLGASPLVRRSPLIDPSPENTPGIVLPSRVLSYLPYENGSLVFLKTVEEHAFHQYTGGAMPDNLNH